MYSYDNAVDRMIRGPLTVGGSVPMRDLRRSVAAR